MSRTKPENVPISAWPSFGGKQMNPNRMGYYLEEKGPMKGYWYRMESEHGETNPVWEDIAVLKGGD